MNSKQATFRLILPTYNERNNIIKLIERILKIEHQSRVHILVVDDDSEDLTWKCVEDHFANNLQITVLRRNGRAKGLVNSLNDGIKTATEDYVIWMDADLQMPVEKISEFISKIDSIGISCVVGSRFLPGGGDIRDEHMNSSSIKVHRILSLILSKFVPTILSINCTDVTSGFIAIKRDFFKSYQLKGIHGEYFIDLMYNICMSKLDYVEIPYLLGSRIEGISKSTNGSYFYMFKTGKRYITQILKILMSKINYF